MRCAAEQATRVIAWWLDKLHIAGSHDMLVIRLAGQDRAVMLPFAVALVPGRRPCSRPHHHLPARGAAGAHAAAGAHSRPQAACPVLSLHGTCQLASRLLPAGTCFACLHQAPEASIHTLAVTRAEPGATSQCTDRAGENLQRLLGMAALKLYSYPARPLLLCIALLQPGAHY